MGTQNKIKKSLAMKKEKRLKIKSLRVRLSDEVNEALNKYVTDKKITKTKIIDDFLEVLLKDYLEK